MIRKMNTEDFPQVMDIWLNNNLKAHSFIEEEYWLKNVAMVRDVLPKAEVYVFVDGEEIDGFVGLENGYIAGIFVKEDRQCFGVGTKLLNNCKQKYQKLCLHAYVKNKRAVAFYLREGFTITETGVDENTGEQEYQMCWHK